MGMIRKCFGECGDDYVCFDMVSFHYLVIERLILYRYMGTWFSVYKIKREAQNNVLSYMWNTDK